jgi:integrase
MLHRDVYYDQDFVFAKTEKDMGYPEFIKTIQNRLRRLLRLAGLNETLTPHSLRHTHTSLLAEAGVGIHEIMERLGHQNDEITKRVYLHITKTMKKEASKKFSELMGRQI